MSLPTWKCETCGKTFSVGEFVCVDGQTNHKVALKEYLLADAPSDPGHPAGGGMDSLRDGRLRICNIPPDKTVMVNGEAMRVPGGYVEFIRGRFSTADPEQQYFLDKKNHYCTEAQWEAAWLSNNQQILLEKQRLAAERQRIENDRNELLAQVKQQKRA